MRILLLGFLVVVASEISMAETPVKFGCAYYPEAWEESRWEQDLADMKAIGLSVVRVGEFNWSGFEPREGEFDFGPYCRFLALCEREGVDVVMCTPTAALPPWMTARYPETERCDAEGHRVPFGSRQSRCPSSPRFRFFAARMTQKMIEAFRGFSCVKLWQVDNELHLNAGFDTCCCESCEKGFRTWLKGRYVSVEALNRSWNHAFWSSRLSDWKDVRLPISKSREAWQTEFVRYQSDTYVDFACEQARIIRAVFPNARVTSNGSEMSGRLRLDSLYRSFGTVAVDTYVSDDRSRERSRWMWGLARGLTGGQKPFWVAEMGPFNWQAEKPGADGELSDWVSDAVNHGAEYVLFFRWRQSINGEQYHPAILPWSGRKGLSYQRVKEIVAKQPVCRLPTGDVAVWHSNASDQDTLVRCDKIQYGPYEEMSIRLNSELERRGILPDYVLSDSDDDLSPYRVIFVPLATIVSEEDVSKLRRFVESGGTLVAFSRLNVLNPRGGTYFTEPYPRGMTDLFGLEVNEQRAFPWKEFSYDRVEPRGCHVLDRLTDSAFAGAPALTENGWGKGRAVYCAYLPSGKGLVDILDRVLGDEKRR